MVKKFFIALIKFYQKYVSPTLGPSCRFYPTCSEYSLQAISKFGALKGSFLSMKRILKCNPWGGSGIDPIPGEE
jgi:putative membrane protein insertion efficiency factor|tara:strand:+ start:208 stop:429 length:222 start_codon:yes stop_codon:yes gene_type:complete